MSYDLYLYRPTSGHTAEEAHAECAELLEAGDGAVPRCFSPWSSVELAGLARAIVAAAPEYSERCEGPDGPIWTGDDGSISICPAVALPSWQLDGNELSVSWPYFREQHELDRTIDPVRRGLLALMGHGVRAFDPQLGREFDPRRDFDALKAQYARVRAVTRDHIAPHASRPSRTRPWWKFW